MRIRFLFAWYDIWIGFFIDKKKKRVYFFPIPMLGIVFDFGLPEGWMKISSDLYARNGEGKLFELKKRGNIWALESDAVSGTPTFAKAKHGMGWVNQEYPLELI